MSRNRCSTSCECGFWSFGNEHELADGAEGLITFDAYMDKLGVSDGPLRSNWGAGHGYGYRDDLHRYTSASYLRAGETDERSKSWTNGTVPPGARILVTYRTEPVPDGQRYRMRHLRCPLCLSQYAGWYRAKPIDVARDVATGIETRSPLEYELYDTSYWYSFNDEPSGNGADGPRRSITPDVVRAALERWFKEAA